MKTLSIEKVGQACIASLGIILCAMPSFAAAAQNYLMWQMPTTNISFPVYVYSGGTQVSYLYGTTQQAFLGAYDPAKTSATYQLYYQNSSQWYGCVIALSKGAIDNTNTTCPGTVINKPVPTSNVYTIGPGATAWTAVSTSPVNPVNTNYGNRTITFMNNTAHPMLQIGEVCTVSANPNNPNCANKQNLFQIPKGGSQVFTVDSATVNGSYAGLISYGFTVTAYMNKAKQWVKTGGYGGANPYATKIEFTSLPVSVSSSGAQFPKGATNFDVSAVDGYNISVVAYPASPAYCTYTVPPEGSNVLGAGYYSQANPLSSLTGASTSALCKSSSQLPAGSKKSLRQKPWNLTVSSGNNFQGCMSPCTYAQKNGSSQANLFCCAGQYNTAQTCDQPSGTVGANNSTYVTNMNASVSTNVYRFAYDDAVGDHACPAETNFVVVFQ